MLGIAPAAQAQDFPTRPVRIITDSAPGSAIDATLRIIADALSRVWGQQAVPINQPGAGGAIAARAAAQAAPDGYTLSMPAVSAFVAAAGAAAPLPIQVPRDFTVIGYLGGAPMFITAAPRLGVKTLAELIEFAQAAAGRARLRHQRPRAAHAPDRRIAAKPHRHQAPDDPLLGRHRAGAQRRDGRAHPAGDRGLFRRRRRDRERNGAAARGRLAQAGRRLPRPADRRRNHSRDSKPAAGRCWSRRSARQTPSCRRSTAT